MGFPWLFALLLLLVAHGVTALAQRPQPSLAEVAATEAERRKTIAEPSRVLTITSPPVGNGTNSSGTGGLSCQSEEKRDSQSANVYSILRCPDGTTTEVGSNIQTGARWTNRYLTNGSVEGIDSCGNRWTYDAATTLYVNENGERRSGLGEFRKRLASPAPCQRRPTGIAVWLDQIETERRALARAEAFALALQSRINALSTDFVNRDDPAQRNVIAADRDKALAELSRVNQEIHQRQRAIEDIQAQVRRAMETANAIVIGMQPDASLIDAARAAERERCLTLTDVNARNACINKLK